jgi:hypothetical protein
LQYQVTFMQRNARSRVSLLACASFAAILVAVCFAGCGTKSGGSGFTPPPDQPFGSPSQNDDASDDGTTSSQGGFGDGGLIALTLDADVPDRAPPPPTCKLPGLWCYQTTAPCTTSLSGKVFDPAGSVPLSGVVVYAVADPTVALDKITTGTNSCSACTTKVDNYMALAVTDAAGHFSMTGVPATTSVPIVVQAGKWRREVMLSSVTKCQDNAVQDGTLRLPKNKTEGDMPEMALLTGGCDDMACFLMNIGIDPNEFGAPHAGGHVDVYQGNSSPLGVPGTGPGLSNGTPGNCTNTSCPLWASKASFEYYDMAIFSCECDEQGGGDAAASNGNETVAGYTHLHDWLNEGGKVFASHYHYTWFRDNPDPAWAATATWLGSSIALGMGTDDIDTSFAKGAAFAQWMGNVGALTSSGPPPTIALASVASSVSNVNTATTSRWIYDPTTSPNDTKYMSFLTPIGGTTLPVGDAGAEGGTSESKVYCGKAVFTDLHTSSGLFATAANVPGDCKAAPLTAQQKALEYLFFDLAACVAPEDMPVPMPPPNPPPPPPPPQ